MHMGNDDALNQSWHKDLNQMAGHRQARGPARWENIELRHPTVLRCEHDIVEPFHRDTPTTPNEKDVPKGSTAR